MKDMINNTSVPLNVVKERFKQRNIYMSKYRDSSKIINQYSEYLYYSESIKKVSLKTAFKYMRITRDMVVFLFGDDGFENLSSQDLNNITIDDLDNFMKRYNAGVKNFGSKEKEFMNQPQTINGHQSAIKKFFKWAYSKEYIDHNVSQKFESQNKVRDDRTITLSLDEIRAVQELMESGYTIYQDRNISLSNKQLEWHFRNIKRDKAIFRIMLYHGLRIEEVYNLNISNFDFNIHEFLVFRKRDKIVTAYMQKDTAFIIKEYIEEERPDSDSDALFLSNHGENINRMSVEQIRKMLKKYMKLINPLKKLSPHKIRATFATKANRQYDLRTAQKLLDHQNSTTTEIYIDDDEEIKKDASLNIEFN